VPLAAADAIALGLWLFVLNGFVFGRSLGVRDYEAIVGGTVLCYAACLQYRLRSGRGWVLKSLIGEALAAGILHYVSASLGLHLSGHQILRFFAWHLPLQLGIRGVYFLARNRLPNAPLELPRLTLIGAAAVVLMGPFVTDGLVGSGDAGWYSIMVADFVSQWRAGIFPVFVGQTPYAFNGAISPLRLAPYYQHLAGVLDCLTGRSLGFMALQNLALVLSVLAGALSAYFCVAAILSRRRWTAACLALLYIACPGSMAMAYEGDLFLSLMALPYIPLVAYGLWSALEKEESTGIAWTALPLAAVWCCHPPIAFWLTVLAVFAHLVRLAPRWREGRIYRECLACGVLFALCAGFVFVSVATLDAGSQVVERTLAEQGLRDAFPDVILPVSRHAARLGDYQLGWALWGVLIGATAVHFWRPRRAVGALLAGVGLLLLLLLPIPGLSHWLWTALPQIVCNLTFYWPMQRFNVIIAAFAVIAGAAAIAALPRSFPKIATSLGCVLACGLLWSGLESLKFLRRGYESRPPAAVTQRSEEIHNIVLTRYSFNPFSTVPSYFSHGYIDPYLENRVLSADQNNILADNAAAARPADGAPEIILGPSEKAPSLVALEPGINLAPGVRYAFRFEAAQPVPPGWLIIEGKAAFREYELPDSGSGIAFSTPVRAFGLLPSSRDFFPIWTSRRTADTVHFGYAFGRPPGKIDGAFARIRIQAYDIAKLPVKITRWAPYEASVESLVAGAWLETPRLWVPGYRASVNNQRAQVSRSVDGRVMIRLEAGSNRVLLTYPGPVLLRLAYYAALISWAVAAARAAISGIRTLRKGSRATA
jgi:hypothetical protein